MSQTGAWPFRLLVAAAVAFVLGGGLYVWRSERNASSQQQAQKPPPAPVGVASIERGAFPVLIDSIGSVQALNNVTIRPRVDGQIEQVKFREGENVKAGDLLVTLDARPFQALLDQAKAKKRQDSAALENARLDLQRYSQLARKEFATEQQLNTQQATVASGQALGEADQAAIESAETQLGYTQIRAPISGRIGFRQVDVGNIVHANDAQPILSIVQVDPVQVLFTVPENRLHDVQEAARQGALETEVFTSDHATALARGKLSVINNQVDATTGTVQLKSLFDNADMRLWPGQSVDVRLHVRDIESAILIPNQALQRGQDGLYAWVVDGGNLARVARVEVTMQGESVSVVKSGLEPGDRVVVSGQYRLFDKAPVAIQADAAQSGKQANAR